MPRISAASRRFQRSAAASGNQLALGFRGRPSADVFSDPERAGAAAAPARPRPARAARARAAGGILERGIGPGGWRARDRVATRGGSRVGAEIHHPLDEVLELAHVARPVVLGNSRSVSVASASGGLL
jgi:hypothetical protein